MLLELLPSPARVGPKQGRDTCTKTPHLPLTSALVGALCVDAVLVGSAMRHLRATLIYVCRRDGDSPAEPQLCRHSSHSPKLIPGLHSPMQRCSCSTQPLLQRRQLESSGPVQRPHAW